MLKGDASIEIMVPANSSFIECEGYIGPDYGVINFSLDPPPPNNVGRGYMSRSTRRPWYTHDTMFSVPLNPNLRYKFKVSTDAATAGAGVYLNSTKVMPYSNNACVNNVTIADTSVAPFWIKEDLLSTDNSANSTANSTETSTANSTTTSAPSANGAGNATVPLAPGSSATESESHRRRPS